jgi:O-antigen ligase
MTTQSPAGRGPAAPGIHGGEIARLVNVVLGLWLIVSAFAWDHAPAQMTNAWLVGVCMSLAALLALFTDARIRIFNTLLAMWLFVSVWVLPGVRSDTAWNNLIVAAVVFLLSMPASRAGAMRHA